MPSGTLTSDRKSLLRNNQETLLRSLMLISQQLLLANHCHRNNGENYKSDRITVK